MRTVRRRPVSPTLGWRAAGPNRQYRVTVRDEDTGEQAIVYEGYRLECHLPAEFRLSANQLTFRVQSRPSDADEPYATTQPFRVVPRLGDELDPEARDVLSGREVPGAQLYRCQIRSGLTREVVVDMTHLQPVFLVPPGRLAGGDFQWAIRPMVRGTWQRSNWAPLDPAAVDEARARAERPVPIGGEERGRAPTRSAVWAAPSAPAASPGERPSVFGIAVPVTAAPQVLRTPTPEAIEREQWGDGSGSGAVERVARGLEARGLTGAFFLDVELGVGLRTDALWRLGRRLQAGGHALGVLIEAGALTPQGIPTQTRIAAMKAVFAERFGVDDPMFMLGSGPGRIDWFRGLVQSGAPSILATRPTLLRLPAWMRWRTAPFAASAETVVFPITPVLSTPAHVRDRVSRHVLSSHDAILAASARAFVAAAAGAAPVLAEIDPLQLLDRRKVVDRDAAHAWNIELRENRPEWLSSGWKRLHNGFEQSVGLSEIRVEMLDRLLEGLAGSRASLADWSALGGDRRHDWIAAGQAFEPLVEYRRGARVFRTCAVRRYDNDFRLALAARA